jgi:mono/diheme cytochrome c family protein
MRYLQRSQPRLTLLASLIFLVTTLLPSMAPAAATSPQVEHGAQLFEQSGCSYCHGPAGIGGGKGPDLASVSKRLKPEAISHQIHEGGKVMPAFGGVLSDEEINDLVQYLRTKRKALKPTVPKP